ncbi:H+/Ca2+ exchanger Vxc1-like protein [Heterobasidion irregulare TC 32-1]|uniref:H+/Ca2+ exchanger Vxc1-like protein n=1 Tax=Heterobasidion irregulare (strain TC 32-1) TaxID=747525 RepID=W4JXL4_HETIT|nr:H+/Ca2+ exchanger Vxc1-like protein [Heterobasidion irregulare TC 32-1]ETW78302.1 H+/Ca2+ exchanger Vxc1-like protein [Heterobasidion irregulare TC 32-1]
MPGDASALIASEKPRQPHSPSLERAEHGLSPSAPPPPHRAGSLSHGAPYAEHNGMARFWARFKGRGRKKVGWADSAKAIVFSSWLNAFLIFIPFAFVARYHESWGHGAAFAFAFLSIVPLEKLFDWGGEQLALYCGEDLGDLIVVTLNNAVEATLAIILLLKCELKLLQSTIAGVVLLHLLLVPGTAFLVGGARIWEQQLHPTRTQLNHTLLTLGVLALVVPAAFFAALDQGLTTNADGSESGGGVVVDALRADFLRLSRGFAIVLLVVYVCSRFYLHDPPGQDNAFRLPAGAPQEAIERERELANAEPEVNPVGCVVLLAVTVAIMAVMAEFLVESIEFVREQGNIQEEWFGLVLLPLISFSADGTVAIVYFARSLLQALLGSKPAPPPDSVAEAKAIDLSIQFTLFWLPFLVLLGWWTGRPLTFLFDLFEVTVLIGSCFLVNYITADAKTNWVEGIIMIAFYLMIGLSAWYYPGQAEIGVLDACRESIAEALAAGVGAGAGAE